MKNLILTLTTLLFAGCLMAQSYSGVSESQYSGYLGTTINPANIVNPHYKVDVHLLSYDLSLVNDYLTLNIDSALNGTGNFFDRFENKNSSSNYANAGIDFEMNWIGGMVAINDKMGIGFGISSRAVVSARGFNKDLIRMSASGLEDSTYFGQSFTDDYTSIAAASWNEYSVTFGAEVLDVGVHNLRVGGALNLLQSNGSFYLHTENLSYEFQDEDTIANVSGTMSYGGNFPNIPSNLAQTFIPFNTRTIANNFGFSVDVGAIYEYTPAGSDSYKLKAGLSFHDIGFLAATPDNNVSNKITFNSQDIDVNFFDGINSFDDINDYIVRDTTFNYTQEQEELMMQTPTRMNLFADFNVTKGFYVSFLSDIALHRRNNGQKVVGINSFELTPRYDFKWFGFALPINYVQYAGFGVGLGFRIGPVYFGTSNIITTFGSSTTLNTLNLYSGFRIPIHKKKAK